MAATSASRLASLGRLLGGLTATSFTIRGRRVQEAGPVRVEYLDLVTPSGEAVRGILTGPEGVWNNRPAVLYCHAHGNRYAIGASELIEGRPALLPEPYGLALAERGIVALCIDMPCFGERSSEIESALAKSLLWQGRTLFGRMLCDLLGAFALLSAHEGTDPRRISTFGFSMGATQAFWLGALEPRLCRIAHACCFADLAMLVKTGAHDLHGPYMTVPGLLGAFTTGEIAGLAAPRPQLACMGLLDPLTPPDAVDCALADLRRAYFRAGAADACKVFISPDSGHVETPEMRAALLAFLAG